MILKRCRQAIVLLSLALLASFANLLGQDTEISLDRSVYLPNEPITVRFKNGPGNVRDWIALYASEKPPAEYIAWQYLDGTEVASIAVTDGQVVFSKGAPEAGDYLIRLLANDGYGVVAFIELTVAVVPRVRTDAQSYKPGAKVTVEFLNGPGNAKDWVAIYRPGAPNSAVLDWFYVDGTQAGATGVAAGTLVFPGGFGAPGDYEVRFFRDDSFDILDTAYFTVENAGPVVTLVPGDRQVEVKWEAVTQPAPVAKYRVLTAPTTAGPFTQIAEVTGLSYLHAGLLNGLELCYVVRAVSASGQEGPDSILQCAAPYVLEAGEYVAFGVPPGTVGNYGFSGQLGLDFEVVNPVRVDQLGAFDDGANGLKATIVVTLYDLTARSVVASRTFEPTAPGVLRGGSRFKPLTAPVNLPKGFRGSIVAHGYSPEEKAGTTISQSLGLSGHSGDDSIFFPGNARNGVVGLFPDTLELGTGIRYAAGTFSFHTTPPTAPGKPIVTAIPGDRDVALFWQTIKTPLPAARYRVLYSSAEDGNFEPLGEVADTLFVDSGRANGTQGFYRVRAIAAGGEEGVDSEAIGANPDAPTAGAPYVVPAETEGNQVFGGSIGNDFDVTRPIRVTKLGVFDDGSNGLQRTLKCRIYNRVTRAEVALLVFDTASPGDLTGGSRFKSLPTPIDLPIGFQGTIVASGYGEGERDANRGAGAVEFETFSGGCLNFVGRARWGDNPDAFPEILDGGPADRYAAGNFYFEPLNEEPHVSIATATGGALRLDWTGVGVLNSAATLAGPWDIVLGAVSGNAFSPQGDRQYFRLRAKP